MTQHGGIIGDVSYYPYLVENCLNYGEIEGHSNTGGIIGYGQGDTYEGWIVNKCINYGYVHSNSDSGNGGALQE